MAGPAAADEAKSVQVVSQEGRDVEFLVYLDPNAAEAAPGADVSSTVVISGVEVPSEATPVVQDTAPKEAILVLDVSGSMRGPRLAAAKEAAINYVNGLPADVEIGLVSFNDTVTVDVRPTTDKQAVIRAIGDLTAGRRTALWDGMIAGLDLANADLGARLLVLSDGGDTVSAATVDDVNARAAAEGIPIDIVALTPTVSHAQALRTVTTASGGQFLLATDVDRAQPGLRRGHRVVRRQGRGVGPGAARGRGERQVRDRDRHPRRHGVHGHEPAASQRGTRVRGWRGGGATDDGRHRRHAG